MSGEIFFGTEDEFQRYVDEFERRYQQEGPEVGRAAVHRVAWLAIIAAKVAQDTEDWTEGLSHLIEVLAELEAMLVKERSVGYGTYLRSVHWQTMRRLAHDRAQGTCELCGRGGQLDVHHKTYERIGEERLDDLIVLCRSCHSKFHDKLPKEDS